NRTGSLAPFVAVSKSQALRMGSRSGARRRSVVASRAPRLRSALVVLVVAAHPDARLVAPLGCAVEPLVDAPEAVQSARIGGIGVVVGPEHEVVDEELRAPSEEVCERNAPLAGLESIFLVDPNPRQLLPPPRQLVTAPRELLLRLEQLEPRCEPLLTCPGPVLRHRSSLLPFGRPWRPSVFGPETLSRPR